MSIHLDDLYDAIYASDDSDEVNVILRPCSGCDHYHVSDEEGSVCEDCAAGPRENTLKIKRGGRLR